ncbi:hypothetical protein BGW39_001331, partial [Mortierella sp. 14UC]
MVMSTGGVGTLDEIQEASERVVYHVQEEDNSVMRMTTNQQQQQKQAPVAERPAIAKDRTRRSSLQSVSGLGHEFWAAVKVSGGGGGGGGGDNNTNNSNSNGKDKGARGGGDGMLQLAEIGCDLGLSLSEFENPDGTLRTNFFNVD